MLEMSFKALFYVSNPIIESNDYIWECSDIFRILYM